jgi:hypothetical protein
MSKSGPGTASAYSLDGVPNRSTAHGLAVAAVSPPPWDFDDEDRPAFTRAASFGVAWTRTRLHKPIR